jgi:hypothetical protein
MKIRFGYQLEVSLVLMLLLPVFQNLIIFLKRHTFVTEVVLVTVVLHPKSKL